jgi:hypothetical protein
MLTTTLTLLAALGLEGASPAISWRSDLDLARKEAAGKGLPLLVVFR